MWFVSYGPFSSLLKSYAKNAEGEALRSSSIFYGGSERGEAKILESLGKVTSIGVSSKASILSFQSCPILREEKESTCSNLTLFPILPPKITLEKRTGKHF